MMIVRPKQTIVYPDSDGQPMAENTIQFRWIVTIREGIERIYYRANVFIAGDLFWYPVEGHPEIRLAPDVLVAFGRPKGERGSYMQWIEGGIAPQVSSKCYHRATASRRWTRSFVSTRNTVARNITSTTRTRRSSPGTNGVRAG